MQIAHDIRGFFREDKIVKDPSFDIYSMPGYVFHYPNDFGRPIGKLRDYLKDNPDSILFVSLDGRYGYIIDEYSREMIVKV